MSKKISQYFKIQPKELQPEQSNKKGLEEIKIKKTNNKQMHKGEICKYCKESFETKRSLLNHINKLHSNKFGLEKTHEEGIIKIFECDFDGKIFQTKKSLQGHMSSHFPKINCPICGNLYQKYALQIHIANRHSFQVKKFPCELCPKSFKSNIRLKAHVKNHNKKFQCQICNSMFPNTSQLNYHKKFYHENPKSFQCEHCQKRFNLKSILDFHMKTHDLNRFKAMKCHRCDFATDIMSNFKQHQKFHKLQDDKFKIKNFIKCKKCPKVFKNEMLINRHMKTHLKDRQCDLCARYMSKQHLRSHMDYHLEKMRKNTLVGL